MARPLAWLRAQATDVVELLRSRAGILASIVLLGTLYLVGLIVPQERALDPRTYAAWRERRTLLVRVLEETGATDVYASPAMYVALAVFFVSLAAVIWDRAPRLWRRTRLEHGMPLDAAAVARRNGARTIPAADAATALDRARAALDSFGYATWRAGPGAVRAVRFRFAPLGFLLFHGSFGLLLVAGILLDVTRSSVTTRVAEGERFDSAAPRQGDRTRRARVGSAPPALEFEVLAIHVTREPGGRPTRVAADLLFAGELEPRRVEVNHPVVRGSTSVLAMNVGPAPVLACEAPGGGSDGACVKLASAAGVTRVRFEGCGLDVLARPASTGPAAPVEAAGTGVMLERVGGSAELSGGLEVAARGPDGRVTRAVLHPGDAVTMPDGRRLEMPEFRAYAELQIVDERGGGLLWAAFACAIVGLLARLVLYRRELAVVADPAGGFLHVAAAADGSVWGGQESVVEALAAMLTAIPAAGEESDGAR